MFNGHRRIEFIDGDLDQVVSTGNELGSIIRLFESLPQASSHKDNDECQIRLAEVEQLVANHGDKTKGMQCCLLGVRSNIWLLANSSRNVIRHAFTFTNNKVRLIRSQMINEDKLRQPPVDRSASSRPLRNT